MSLLLLLTLSATAHDFWLKPGASQAQAVLIYGHEGDEDPYTPGQVKKASGLDAQGAPTRVSSKVENGRCVLSGSPDTVQLGAEVDTGFWTKTVQGWSNKGKREVGNALLSEWSLYSSKALLKPAACLNRSFGHRLEFIPQAVDATSARLLLTLNGKPLPQQPVYSQHEKLGSTDEAGVITVKREALTVVSANKREPLANNPDADRLNLHAVLSF